MWNPDILEYIFSQALPSSLPPADADGRVTLYRGMGELSQLPEKAISWSTHPGNALWFAVHCGQGTHIAVARVRPEDIVAYDEGYRVENEVILRPGTEKEWFYEDMIPAVKETVPLLLAPTLLDFTWYGCLAFGLGYPEENDFQIHGVRHVLRVLLLSLLYIHHAGDLLTEADRQILIYFSLLHDIGRVSDGREPTHFSFGGERFFSQIPTKSRLEAANEPCNANEGTDSQAPGGGYCLFQAGCPHYDRPGV